MSRRIKLLLIASAISSAFIIFVSMPIHLPFVGVSDAEAAMAAPEPGTLAVLGLAGGFGLVKRLLKKGIRFNRKVM